MTLAPYPKYKPSGVVWLGNVPEHWEVRRLKFLLPQLESGASVNGEKEPADNDSLGVLKTSCVYGNRFRPEENKRVIDADLNRVACPVTGDSVIVSRMNTPELVGSCGYVAMDYPNLFLPDRLWTARFSPVHRLSGKYAWYLLTSHALIDLTGALATGTSGSMKNLSQDEFLGIDVAAPLIDEQRAITDFLDRETAKIDTLVAKKRTLIERLKEKRTALISRTVTRGLPPDAARAAGLDPHPRLKPSGIDWLGDVPEHWEVKRLKFILVAALKYGANESAELDDPTLPRYVRITDIDESDGLREETFRSLPADVAAEYLLREGDLLFARSGATAGKTFLYRQSWGKCAYAGYLIRARIDKRKGVPEFVRHFTASSFYWQWLASVFIQSTIQNVSAERYASLWIPLPPTMEQAVIAQYLDRELTKLDGMVAKIETAIERLQEYRTALITAAVTGKIDVRGAAA